MDYEEALLQVTDVLRANNRYRLGDFEQAVKLIREIVTPKGKWIFSGVEHTDDNPIDCDSYYCSLCKRSISTTLTRPTDLFPFCHCGADMR
jgi:hypothetical protein